MNTEILWNNDEPITELGIDVPAWIDQDITSCTVAAIIQGGCASGAYIDAVTYWKANDIMAQHGDEVLEFIEENKGELPDVTGESWKGVAVKFLSCAVELWACGIEEHLAELLEEKDGE